VNGSPRRLKFVGAAAISAAALSLGSALPVEAALVTATSEALTNSPVPAFGGETIDSQILGSTDLMGHVTIVNFFASWCDVCRAENKELEEIYAAYNGRSVKFLGILVDPIETPDSVPAAMDQLHRSPTPYPVVMMNESLRGVFQYVGFPTLYFITSDSRFSTTLYGYHPRLEISALLERLLDLAGDQSRSSSPTFTVATEPVRRQPWDRRPFLALVPRSWKQWHPMLVHFPIAFLALEAFLLLLNAFGPGETLERSSMWILALAVLSLLPTVYTGVSDVGASLGPGWSFWNGLQDRFRQFLRLESTISLHALAALATCLLAAVRLMWRLRARGRALRGGRGIAFGLLTFLGLWLLFAAGQVGGSISHP